MKHAHHAFFLLLITLPHLASSKHLGNLQVSDSISYIQETNIIAAYMGVETTNDFNPLLNILSNDDGYTVGLKINGRYYHPTQAYYIDFSVSTDLYTRHFWEDRYRENGRIVIPQYFNEINTLSAKYSRILQSSRLILSLESSVGIRNRQEPIPGFALYIQGGEDGRGGYHSLNPKERAQDNLSTGNITPFISIAPSLTKHFILYSPSNNKKDKPYLALNTGVSIGSHPVRSHIFLKYDAELPVWQYTRTSPPMVKVSLRTMGNVSIHQEGVLFQPEFGFEINVYRLQLGYSSYLNIGKWQSDVVSYYDHESNMRAYLRFLFN